MSRRRFTELLLARWGFAAMVLVAIALGFVAAAMVEPPPEIPSIALQAVAVYRVEVGGAVFLGLYLTTMAFALAVQNLGFTEIGSGGIRARELYDTSRRAAANARMEVILDLMDEVRDLQTWREREEDAHR